MLDLKRLQQDPEAVEAALQSRSPSLSLDSVLSMDAERKRVIGEHDELRHKQRDLSEVFRSNAPAEEKASAR
jgi:seryl-tRNA synthetase